MTPTTERRGIPIRDAFFCDGAWYVLSSSSLGGSDLTDAGIGAMFQSEDSGVFTKLLANGVCLPLHFPGDCALDPAVIIEGDLDEEEERGWIGRLRSKIEIPRGEFMIMGASHHRVAFAGSHSPTIVRVSGRSIRSTKRMPSRWSISCCSSSE